MKLTAENYFSAEAQRDFWARMTPEERREKRKQYDLAQAKRLAAEASAAKDGGGE